MKELDDEAKKALERVAAGEAEPIVGSNVNYSEAARKLQQGIQITYRDLTMLVERRSIEEVRRYVSDWDKDKLEFFLAHTASCLDEVYGTIVADQFTKEEADNFYADLVIWSCVKEKLTSEVEMPKFCRLTVTIPVTRENLVQRKADVEEAVGLKSTAQSRWMGADKYELSFFFNTKEEAERIGQLIDTKFDDADVVWKEFDTE